MDVPALAIRRPVFTLMLSLALVILGCLAASRLGTNLYPDVSMPFATVITVYPGAGPKDIESEITQTIENAVSGISGLQRLFSQSREDVSIVFVQFKMSTPLDTAMQQVRDAVSLVAATLPSGSRLPVVSPYNIASQPILLAAIEDSSSSEKEEAPGQSYLLDVMLADKIEKFLLPVLEQIDGVAVARLVGRPQQQIAVEVNQKKLSLLGMGPMMLLERLRAENLSLPSGRYENAGYEVGVRVLGSYDSMDALKNLSLGISPEKQPIFLQDVAQIHHRQIPGRTLVRNQSQRALALEIIKQPGANTVEVAQKAKEVLERFSNNKEMAFKSQILLDPSEDIEANAHEVWLAIYFGGAMACLIIFIFLMDLRGTLISALALPTSVLGTLFVMWMLGFSLNQLTLLALSLAIGLLIDDAVVVRESINKRLEIGIPPMQAALEGTREVGLAVMATTFTLCAVFLPVSLMRGIVGQFFQQFGITMTVAVLFSLLIAFTLDPMLSSRFSKQRKTNEAPEKTNRIKNLLHKGFTGLERGYGLSLQWVLAHRGVILLLTGLLLVGTWKLSQTLGSDFVGQEDRAQLLVELQGAPGTSLQRMADLSGVVEQAIQKLDDVTNVYAVIGADDQIERAKLRVQLTPKDKRVHGIDFYKTELRRLLAQQNDLLGVVSNPPLLEGLADWPPVVVQILGPDLQQLEQEATLIYQTIQNIPGTADVQLKIPGSKNELQFVLNRPALARAGIPAALVASQTRLAILGDSAGKLRDGRQELDIWLQLREEDRSAQSSIADLPIFSPFFLPTAEKRPVFYPLKTLATTVNTQGPVMIEHEMRQRQISVVAQLAQGAHLGEVSDTIRHKLEEHRLADGYSYLFSGQQNEMRDMQKDLQWALGLGLLFIFMILASQFNSLLHPWTMMLSLPLAFVGAIAALALGHYTIGMGAYIAFILLMGIVTKNSILLVDCALQYMKQKQLQAGAAMILAGPHRLRPILMTSAAMILGMLPTALGKGMGSEFRSPMAVCVIGGVISSTFLTLFVLPVLFTLVENIKDFFMRKENNRLKV